MDNLYLPLKATGADDVTFARPKDAPAANPFCLSFNRRGVHAWQYMSREDVAALRDWCDRVLKIAKADEKVDA